MKYNKMFIYRLKRSDLIDKNGRPAIFLEYFGDQSLVWCGTTNKNSKATDKPIVMNLNGKPTYFYNHNIEKISTQCLVAPWENQLKKESYSLNNHQQQLLINKLISFTNQKHSYQKINILKIENTRLKIENKLLKQEKYKLENELEYEYEIDK